MSSSAEDEFAARDLPRDIAGPRVLVLDDDPLLRDSLLLYLSGHNPSWQLVWSASVSEARTVLSAAIARGEPIDVLLTDLWMGSDRSGSKTIDLISEATQQDPMLVSILFTGQTLTLEDRFNAFDKGAFDVVDKNATNGHLELMLKARTALRFREQTRRLSFVQRYFDRHVFDLIAHGPSLLALRQSNLTVCFWDIRGFSKLAVYLGSEPELIAGFLQDYCDAGARAIFDNGGVLDKFIGDGIMALFGVGIIAQTPEQEDAAAVAAVRAAVRLRDEFSAVVERWEPKWRRKGMAQDLAIGLGCGLHTGPVLVGNAGTEFRDQFTALGPHVNLAARLQSSAKGGEIVMSKPTRDRVEGHFKTRHVRTLKKVKNIDGSFPVYTLE